MPHHHDTTKPATIREVAARAGVSTATVSRSLRGGVGVEPATRQKVEDAARELRYRPSGVARSLKLRATSTIGLIVTDIENPYFPQIVSAVEDAVRARGFTVLLADGRRDPERELESLDILGEREVDGMIIASTAVTQRHRERIRELHCPVVIINSESTVPSVPAVMSDNVMGGAWPPSTSLVWATGPSSSWAMMRNTTVPSRLASTALARRSPSDPMPPACGSEPWLRSEPAMAPWKVASTPHASCSRHPFTETAVLCRNDLTAIGVMRGLRAAGRRVPADISVVGYDDIELAAYVDPSLTTVRQSTDEMARRAVADLFGRLGGDGEPAAGRDGPPGETTMVPVELIVRGSSGPAPR